MQIRNVFYHETHERLDGRSGHQVGKILTEVCVALASQLNIRVLLPPSQMICESQIDR